MKRCLMGLVLLSLVGLVAGCRTPTRIVGIGESLPPTAPLGCVSSVFLCVLDDEADWNGEPDETYRNLILFSGTAVNLHNQIVSRLQAYNEWLALHFPITEKIAAQELSIPCNQSMTDDDISKVIVALNSWRY